MLTGILAIIGAACSVIAKIISFIPWWLWVCIAIFFLGGWVFYGGSCRDFVCNKRKDPKPIKWEELTVSSAITGASLECRIGIRGRRTKSVNLAHIEAPSDSHAEESRASLERLAGNFIRIPYQGIRKIPVVKTTLMAANPGEPIVDEKLVKCEECNGTGVILDTYKVNCFCQKDQSCIGKLDLSYDTIYKGQELIIQHLGDDGCQKCQDIGGPCEEISQELNDIILSNPKEPQTIQCCECGGSGKCPQQPLEAQLVVSLVYSSYGQCLNTEQVRLGMAKLLPDAPKDWKKFEDEAKKKNLGVWKKGSHR